MKQQGSFVRVVLESPRPGGLGSNSTSPTLPSEGICWALYGSDALLPSLEFWVPLTEAASSFKGRSGCFILLTAEQVCDCRRVFICGCETQKRARWSRGSSIKPTMMLEWQERTKVIQWPSNAGEGSPAYKPASPSEELRSYRYGGGITRGGKKG